MTRYITVTISPEGETKIEAFGYVDGKCRDATRDYEQALGIVVDRVVKDDACIEQGADVERVKG